jgi:hypothetical protein
VVGEAPSGLEPLEESSGGNDTKSCNSSESNPRSQLSASDSEEDPDLASADAAETASEPRHKPGSNSSPVIFPGQLSVFDLLDGADDECAG